MTPPYGGVWTSIQFPPPFLTPFLLIGIIFPLFPVREDRTKGHVVRGWRRGPAPKAAEFLRSMIGPPRRCYEGFEPPRAERMTFGVSFFHDRYLPIMER